MTPPLVLDADALDALCAPVPPARLRAFLAEAHRREAEVLVPSIVCTEVCRGASRTRAVESTLARHERTRGERPAVRLLDTDFVMARQVGAILHASGGTTADLVDAHVIAACVPTGGGLVLTSDPDDITRLAEAVPAVRIVVRTIPR